jgi:hypothetical protein
MSDELNNPDPSQLQNDPTLGQPTSEPPEWAKQLMAQNQQLQQNNQFLAQQVNQLALGVQQAPQGTRVEIDPLEWQTNPQEVIARVVEQKLSGINQFAQRLQRRDLIQEAVDYYTGFDPDFAAIKSQFVQLLNQVGDVNAQTAQVAYYTAKGYHATQNRTPQQVQQPVVTKPAGHDTSTIPAHMRPSGASGKPQGGATKLRPLTENEEIIRKKNRMSHADYLYGRGEITKAQLDALNTQK